MKTLVVVRHGKSDWTAGLPDRERPLNARGQRQAAEAGAWLAATVPDLQRAVVSPAERARATWTLVAAEYPRPPELVIDERMYAGSLRHIVDETPPSIDSLALVGHNPDVEGLVESLTGQAVTMPTSSVVVLTWASAGPLASISASLRAHTV